MQSKVLNVLGLKFLREIILQIVKKFLNNCENVQVFSRSFARDFFVQHTVTIFFAISLEAVHILWPAMCFKSI